MSTNK